MSDKAQYDKKNRLNLWERVYRFFHSTSFTLFSVGLAVLIPMTVLSGVFLYKQIQIRESAVLNDVLRMTRILAHNQKDILQSAESMLLTLWQRPEFKDFEGASCVRALQESAGMLPNIKTVSIISWRQGQICTYEGVTAFDKDQISPDALEQLKQDQRFSTIWHDKSLHHIHTTQEATDIFIRMLIPVMDESRNVEWIIESHLPFTWLFEISKDRFAPDDVYLDLLDENGNILIEISSNNHDHNHELIQELSVISEEETSKEIQSSIGDIYFAVKRISLSGGHSLSFFAHAHERIIMASAEKDFIFLMIGSFLIGTLALALAFYMAHLRVVRPVMKLEKFARRLSTGQPGSRIKNATATNEIKALTLALDHTADVLTNRQTELIAAIMRAEIANKRKADFVAHLSHELRTPLNAIIGFGQIISNRLMGPLSEPYCDYATSITTSGEHLLHMINEMLDLASIEADREHLKEQTFELFQLIEQVCSIVRRLYVDNGVRLQQKTPAGEITIHADRAMIKQAMINILANAMKYTPAGGDVTVSVLFTQDGLAIEIADNGPGMTKEELTMACAPFERLGDNPYNSRGDGVGLGLPIAMGLMESHDGRLEIESKKDMGTKVRLHLPGNRILRVSDLNEYTPLYQGMSA